MDSLNYTKNKVTKIRRLSPELREAIRQAILEDHERGYADRLSQKFGVKKSVIWCYASKMGVGCYRDININKDALILDYNNGVPLHELGSKYHHFEGDIKKLLLKNGVSWRKPGALQKQYEWDTSFFKCIDTHEKAYWLGFIYADGNVRTKENYGKVFQICLGNKDRSHLMELRESLKSNHPIHEDRGKPRFIIAQTELYDDLVKLGCGPRKSLTLKFPTSEQVPTEFINSFILGVFDGDGSISVNKLLQWHFEIIGPNAFLLKLQDIIVRNTVLQKNELSLEKRKAQGQLFYLVWGGGVKLKRSDSVDRVRSLYNYLYQGSPICLKRKRIIFERLIEYCDE